MTAEDLQHKTIRFFAAQGCCGPSVQMAMTDEKPETDHSFVQDDIHFSIDPAIADLLNGVTLAASEHGFKLVGFQSGGCC